MNYYFLNIEKKKSKISAKRLSIIESNDLRGNKKKKFIKAIMIQCNECKWT